MRAPLTAVPLTRMTDASFTAHAPLRRARLGGRTSFRRLKRSARRRRQQYGEGDFTRHRATGVDGVSERDSSTADNPVW